MRLEMRIVTYIYVWSYIHFGPWSLRSFLSPKYPTSKVLTAIPLTLCSAHLTPALLRKAVLLSRAAVPSPIEKVYIQSVR